MIDQIQLQDDLYGLLVSDPRLAKVNVVNERKFRLQADTLFSSIWMTPRNGSQGWAGIPATLQRTRRRLPAGPNGDYRSEKAVATHGHVGHVGLY